MISSASARFRRSQPGDGGRREQDCTSSERRRALEGHQDGLAHGQRAEQRARPGTPGPGPTAWRVRAPSRARCPSRGRSTWPVEGTKPEIAFISVDLPAPLVPMRPTSSPLATVDARRRRPPRRPPKRTATLAVASQGTPSATAARVPRSGHGARHRAGAGSALVGVAGAAPFEHEVARRCRASCDEPAGEVEQQDQQADVGGQQLRRVPAAEHERARPTTQTAPSIGPATVPMPADDGDGHELQRRLGRERALGARRHEPGRRNTSRPPAMAAMPPDTANADSFAARRRHGGGRGHAPRCRARR